MKRPSAKQGGLTLVELMIAVTVASLTMVGAFRLYSHTSTAYRAAQAQASLEESARLALTALRQDIESAGHYAFADARQITAAPGAAMPGVGNDCDSDWAIRVHVPVAGNNNTFRWTCRAYGNAAAAGADTLEVRFVDDAVPATLEPGRIYLESNADGTGQLVTYRRSTAQPDEPLQASQPLQSKGYYVSHTSAGSPAAAPVPSLRVKALTGGIGGPRIVDTEVQPGVEDLQIEFGIDTDAPATPGFGQIDRFVPPGESADERRVLAVRLWLRVRSQWRENALPPQAVQAYADRPAVTLRDGYRRTVVSATVAVDSALAR